MTLKVANVIKREARMQFPPKTIAPHTAEAFSWFDRVCSSRQNYRCLLRRTRTARVQLPPRTAAAYTVQTISAFVVPAKTATSTQRSSVWRVYSSRQNCCARILMFVSNSRKIRGHRKIKLGTPNILKEFSNFYAQPLPPHFGLPRCFCYLFSTTELLLHYTSKQ